MKRTEEWEDGRRKWKDEMEGERRERREGEEERMDEMDVGGFQRNNE